MGPKKINTKKRISSIISSEITLTNNEIKDIIKVFKSIESRVILLKGTSKIITSPEGWLLNFLKAMNDYWFTINEKCTHSIS